MYDILFICELCGTHLSADENDVGAIFPCPECANDLTVPVGDILFECPVCEKSLLAGKAAAWQQFHCPECQQLITIPLVGKNVPVSKPPPPVPPPSAAVPPTTPENPQPKPPPSDLSPNAADQRFMSTWGDYLAEAGLTDEPPAQPRPPDN
ncbi:MAG: hypothetical protein RBS84_08285 [Kiritimatiellia bacterium]|jgi:predicted RNA-binding Zn-ribbon protein involved in translation (DUF1610 family)|nr:hypothetical protein [Kiritimatiellia bacterium]